MFIALDIASEIVGIGGQMAIRCGGTMNTIANMSMNTPTYSYAYKYATFDGLRRCAAARRQTEMANNLWEIDLIARYHA